MTKTTGSGNELPDAFQSLAAFFGDQQPLESSHPTIEEVSAYVAGHVARLLESHPGLLMSLLYRIDVAEPKVRQVLELEPPGSIVESLTALIIERQLEKVRLRRRFREQENDSL